MKWLLRQFEHGAYGTGHWATAPGWRMPLTDASQLKGNVRSLSSTRYLHCIKVMSLDERAPGDQDSGAESFRKRLEEKNRCGQGVS